MIMQPNQMDTGKAENEIILALQEELFYYQAVTDLLSKQKETVKNDTLHKLDQLFGRMQEQQRRIQNSVGKVEDLMGILRDSSIIPCMAIGNLVTQIEKAIKKNLLLLREIEKMVIFKRDKIKLELKNLTNSRQIGNYGRKTIPLPQFVDKTN